MLVDGSFLSHNVSTMLACQQIYKIVTFSFFKMTGDIHSKRLELRIFQLLMPLRRVMPQDVVSSCLKFRQETPNRLHRLHLIQSLLNRKLPIFKRCLRIHSNHDIHLTSGNLDTGLNLGRTKTEFGMCMHPFLYVFHYRMSCFLIVLSLLVSLMLMFWLFCIT